MANASRCFDMARIFAAPRSTHWIHRATEKKRTRRDSAPLPLFAPRRTNLLLQTLEPNRQRFSGVRAFLEFVYPALFSAQKDKSNEKTK